MPHLVGDGVAGQVEDDASSVDAYDAVCNALEVGGDVARHEDGVPRLGNKGAQLV